MRKTRGKAAGILYKVARDGRKEQTPAEKVLWNALRGRALDGLKFRKQHPCGRFVLDFFCVEQQIALEVDGSVHEVPENKLLDQERTLELNEKGIRVLRFTNQEVMENLENVLEQIKTFVRENPLKGNEQPHPLLKSQKTIARRSGAGGGRKEAKCSSVLPPPPEQ